MVVFLYSGHGNFTARSPGGVFQWRRQPQSDSKTHRLQFAPFAGLVSWRVFDLVRRLRRCERPRLREGLRIRYSGDYARIEYSKFSEMTRPFPIPASRAIVSATRSFDAPGFPSVRVRKSGLAEFEKPTLGFLELWQGWIGNESCAGSNQSHPGPEGRTWCRFRVR